MLTRETRVNAKRSCEICGERVLVFNERLGIVGRDCIYGLGKFYDNYAGGKLA